MVKRIKAVDLRRDRDHGSDVHIKAPEQGITAADKDQIKALRKTRRRAQTMRNQGWTYEMQGREAAFREAADLVKKWLVKDTPVSKSEIDFVAKLLEQSAELYGSATPRKK